MSMRLKDLMTLWRNLRLMNDITYCPNRKCEHIECLRHNKNAPFNIMISRFQEIPKQDKDGKCKEYLV